MPFIIIMKAATHSKISPAASLYRSGLSFGSIKEYKATYITQFIKKNKPIEIGGTGTLIFLVNREIKFKVIDTEW